MERIIMNWRYGHGHVSPSLAQIGWLAARTRSSHLRLVSSDEVVLVTVVESVLHLRCLLAPSTHRRRRRRPSNFELSEQQLSQFLRPEPQ